jgi:hypothetical protein
MNPNPELDRVFPLSAGSAERTTLRPPRLFGTVRVAPGFVMGNNAFIRTWPARRAPINAAPARQPSTAVPGG